MYHKKKIAVIGQGYVGLPLAIELATHFCVVGYDVNQQRIAELKGGRDRTNEADLKKLNSVLYRGNGLEGGNKFTHPIDRDPGGILQPKTGLHFSSDVEEIRDAKIFIVTVPTPIDRYNAPDLSPLIQASKTLGSIIKEGDIVVYESTVYPGCTEEECIPVLEKVSGLLFNRDFFVGYSPERVSPGDRVNTLTTIKKVTSGSTPEIADEIDQLYKTIIKAGTHLAPSIKVAEASKAIENAQRDVNISFINELALIFDRIGIDTNDVLKAAGTKFNFLAYKPGLVGGHCISVDPYYLTHKAIQLGYYPDVILSGRKVNNSIPAFIVSKVVKLMIAKDITIRGARVLILGIAFKENCPDIRNTKVIGIYNELSDFGMDVDIYDPWANLDEVFEEYGISALPSLEIDVKKGEIASQFPLKGNCPKANDRFPHMKRQNLLVSHNLKETKYDAIILATAHEEFLELNLSRLVKKRNVVFDTKGCLDRSKIDARL